MKKILITASLLAVIGSFSSCEAALQYWGTDGGDWDTPAHWVSGNATAGGDSVQINAGRTANITTTIASRSAYTTIGNNTGGTSSLIVRSGGKFAANNGAATLNVGGTAASSSDGIFTVLSGGTYEHINGNLEIGNTAANAGAGNTGTVTFESGSTFDLRNGNVNVNQGTLRFENGVTIGGYALKNDLRVQDGGTLEFQTVGSSVTTLTRSTGILQSLTLDAASTLSMELTGAHSVGDTWTLMTAAQSYSGTFGTIVDSTVGHEDYVFSAAYGTSAVGPGALVVTLDAIPEPATLGMVAVFGGGLLFIRRRMLI